MSTHALLPTSRRAARGVTLVELMVAVAIGAFLMIGAMTVFVQSQTTFRINQSVARLQENARFALAAIEPDIRMASFYGLSSRGVRINGRAKITAATPSAHKDHTPACLRSPRCLKYWSPTSR